MKKLLTTLFTGLLGSRSPPDGLYESFYDNGQLMWRRNYIDGKENGLLEVFHHNGQLLSRENYIDGKEDGLRETFHENGQSVTLMISSMRL